MDDPKRLHHVHCDGISIASMSLQVDFHTEVKALNSMFVICRNGVKHAK